MPTADQRLDQLEPVISEMLARLDETAAKVERVSAQVRQLTLTVTHSIGAQSDNIIFLLEKTAKLEQGQADLRQEMTKRFENVDQRFDQLFDYLKDKLK